MSAYLKKLVDEFTGAGLELPVPVARYFAGEACPFALDTRKRLPEWCAAHGYSEAQRQVLRQLIGLIVRRKDYLRAIIAGANRMDLDGADTGPVSEPDRETARAAIIAMRQKSQAKPAQPPKPALEQKPAPAKPTDALAAAIATVLATQAVPETPTASAPPAAPPKSTPTFVRVALPRRTASAPSTPRPARLPAGKISRPSPPAFLPTSVIREAVERIGGRRHSVRMIATFSRAQNQTAATAERDAWIADSIRSLVADGHLHDAVAVQVPQVVDYMLTGVVSRQA